MNKAQSKGLFEAIIKSDGNISTKDISDLKLPFELFLSLSTIDRDKLVARAKVGLERIQVIESGNTLKNKLGFKVNNKGRLEKI